MANPLLSAAAWSARRLPMPVKRLLYRIPPLARLLRGALNRAAPAGMSQVEIAAGGLQGMHMLLDLHSEKDYWLGTYEPELQTAIAELIQPGMVVYDVGANVGYISLLLAHQAGPAGHAFAFEALPDNVARLRQNVALNQLDSRVTIVPAAVVETSRPVRFLVGPSDDMGKAEGSAGRQEIAYSQAIEVPGLSLDDFVYAQGNPPPQAVKLDIEGGEVLALPGMRRLLQTARPLALIELHGPEAARAAWDGLQAAGYRICRLQRGFPEVAALADLDWKAYLAAFPPAEAPDES
jgi:FkbM family methyltransferase